MIYLLWNRRERRLRAFWRILVQFISMIIIGLTVAFLLSAAEPYLGSWISSNPRWELFSGFVIQASSLILGGLLCYRLVDRRRFSDLRMDVKFLREFLAGCGLGAFCMTWVLLIGLAGRWVEIVPKEVTTTWSEILGWQLLWFLVMVTVGVSEEIFSRGCHLKNLAEGFRPLGLGMSVVLSTMLSSVVFGALHLTNPNANWISTINITSAGIFLAVARIATGSLALPIGIHTTWNFFQGPVFGFSVSGIVTPGSALAVRSTGAEWLTGGAFGPEAGALGLMATLIGGIAILVWRLFTSHDSAWRTLRIWPFNWCDSIREGGPYPASPRQS